ncbi:MAG: hypothetical protein ACPGUC_04010 [Gammaproteobacteria bacterium]
MILNVTFDGARYQIGVEDQMVSDAEPMFSKMDADMAEGYRMGVEYVESPDHMQRAQIVADKLARAISQENESMAMAMAAYLMNRLPGVIHVDIDNTGDFASTQFSRG